MVMRKTPTTNIEIRFSDFPFYAPARTGSGELPYFLLVARRFIFDGNQIGRAHV